MSKIDLERYIKTKENGKVYKDELALKEIIDAYTKDDPFPQVEYTSAEENIKIRKIKNKKFLNTLLSVTTVAAMSTLSFVSGFFTGEAKGYKDVKTETSSDEMSFSTLDSDNKNYTEETAPDVVVLKYLEYVKETNPEYSDKCNQVHNLYYSYVDDMNNSIIKKENDSHYNDFRIGFMDVVHDIDFGVFGYSIAIDKNGNVIEDNTKDISIDNEEATVYLPIKGMINTEDIKDDSFIQDGVLYMSYKNNSNSYHR